MSEFTKSTESTESLESKSKTLSEDDEVIVKKNKHLTSTDILNEINVKRGNIISLDLEQDNLLNEMFEKIKKIKSDKRKLNRSISNLEKKLINVIEKEKLQAAKEKRKRKGPNNGGFNKKSQVPKTLRIYLNLEEDKLTTRPELIHLFNEKIKKDGFRDGKKIILKTKKVAKLFGKKKNYVIEFEKLQTFIAELCSKDITV